MKPNCSTVSRTGGQLEVAQGVERVSCVPDENYHAMLYALKDSSIDVLICRNKGGAP